MNIFLPFLYKKEKKKDIEQLPLLIEIIPQQYPITKDDEKKIIVIELF